MTEPYSAALPAANRTRLWSEVATLYLGVPLVLAFLLPPEAMFTVLSVMTAVGIVLLHRTSGFEWASLLEGWRDIPWGFIAIFAAVTMAIAAGVTLVLFPQNLFILPRVQPGLFLMIMILYPFLSALPQELIFRPLFFRRYGVLFPNRTFAVWLNALLFAFAHLMYPSAVVLAMTFSGGLAFAWAYAIRGNFPAAFLLHAISGQIVFASGLGVLFYSGAVN